MNNCCVCLEDTDDAYCCKVCKEGNLCWDCWDRLYDNSGYDNSIYTPCPICKSNLNWMILFIELSGFFEGEIDYWVGMKEHRCPPVFKKLFDWMEKGLLY